jgi:D-alanine-D-alanine ligase
VFLALHGGQGEDGTVQALLDLVGVPYTGSGHLASALAMDKHLTKVVLRAAGVATADWMMAPAHGAMDADEVGRYLDWPVVVKPSKQGSTVGLSIVRAPGDLAAAVAEAFKYDDEVMVERFVPGQELTVGILGDDVLPTIEIVPVKELYDYECKYTPGMAKEWRSVESQPEPRKQYSGSCMAWRFLVPSMMEMRTRWVGVWQRRLMQRAGPMTGISAGSRGISRLA